MTTSVAFTGYQVANGVLADFSAGEFPTILSTWLNGGLLFANGATHFGFVHEGNPVVNCQSGRFQLKPGMYFSVQGEGGIEGGGRGIVVSRLGYRGFFQIGGPIEDTGRLKYIDGCTDSLLIPPVLMGDPCFNLLYFPPNIKQTQHTHPSIRVGMVVRGTGRCITPEGVTPLFPGQVFVIQAGGDHCFHTDKSSMAVVAYHPDSDYGPTHENHPMINRTIVDGLSAARLAHIRTK